MNNLEKDVDTLTQLLKENREDVSNELSRYADEESFMRMQLMLREYFKKEKKRLQQEIDREAQLITTIFPDVDVENLKELLYEVGDQPDRSKIVIKRLSSKNGIKRANNKVNDDCPITKKFKRDVLVIKEDDAVICVDDDDDEKDNASGSALESKEESEVSEMDLEEIALSAFESLAGPSGYSPPNNFPSSSNRSPPTLIPFTVAKQEHVIESPKTHSVSSEGPYWSSTEDEDDFQSNLKSWHTETNRQLIETEIFNNKFKLLRDILPDADPLYLQEQCKKLIKNDPRQFDLFVNHAIEHRNYPTTEDNPRLQHSRPKHDPTELYTTKFNVSEYLEVVPDPETYFDIKRVTKPWSEGCTGYAAYILSNMYNRVSPNAIVNVLQSTSNFLAACDVLDTFQKDIVKPKHYPMPLPIQNISLLQEIAFKTHHTEIMQSVTKQKESLKQRIIEAKAAGTIQTCICCYDEDVLPDDMFECEEYCRFCRECIRRSVEISYGNGKLAFECLNNCRAQFTLNVLEKVLPPKLFSKISYKKQMEEVKAAGIENLEFCPFCDFAAIPAQENKIFSCLNPDCMKESCRLCKEPSHIPYRCEEVEKDENVQARTYIENKMTEALLKKCYQCSKPFIKDDGCNMITCSCGAKMCYLCEKIVTSYDHFNGLGGENFDRCPLYTDTLKMSEQKVNEVAQKAKDEVINNAGKLKIDPTADIPNYFEELRKKRGAVPHLQVLEWMEGHNDINRNPNRLVNAQPGVAANPRMGVRIVFSNRANNNREAGQNIRIPNRPAIRMPNVTPIQLVNNPRVLSVRRLLPGGHLQVIPPPGGAENPPIRFTVRQLGQTQTGNSVNDQLTQPIKRIRVQKTGIANQYQIMPTATNAIDYPPRTVVAPMDLSMGEPAMPHQPEALNPNSYRSVPISYGPIVHPYVQTGPCSSSQVAFIEPQTQTYVNQQQPGPSNCSHHKNWNRNDVPPIAIPLPREDASYISQTAENRLQSSQPGPSNYTFPGASLNVQSGPSNSSQITYMEPQTETYINEQPGPSNRSHLNNWKLPRLEPTAIPIEMDDDSYSSQTTVNMLHSSQPGSSTCTHGGSTDKFQPWH